MTPLVFDIRGFSLDDGPGIRTTVFLKGCPLTCVWCHNPESWSTEAETAFYPDKCVWCGQCLRVCLNGAIDMELKGRINRDKCAACGLCAEACPSTALRTIGRRYPPGELLDALIGNRVFFECSGGGVTFSGGEPTLHMNYLEEVMKGLKASGIHIALQTSGVFELTGFTTQLLPLIDLIYYDLKFVDAETHRKFTGSCNRRILENFKYLVKEAPDRVVARTPLVPGITDTAANLEAISYLVGSCGCKKHVTLPYNSGGLVKRAAIGLRDSSDLTCA